MVDEAAARERQSANSYRTVIYYPALNIARLVGGVVTPEDMAAVMIKHAALFVDDVTGEPMQPSDLEAAADLLCGLARCGASIWKPNDQSKR